jgi:hypothetical protein
MAGGSLEAQLAGQPTTTEEMHCIGHRTAEILFGLSERENP